MMNKLESKALVLEQLSLIENVRVLDGLENKKLGFLSEHEIWEINTEILIRSKIFPVVFHISFQNHFPTEIPKIYLSPDTYEKVKYIPHVGTNRLVCTFDSAIVSTNVMDPFGIVIECLHRAKEIITDGLNKVNNNDFLIEFKAYWEEIYENESHPRQLLSIINELKETDEPQLICLNSPFNSYRYILHKSDSLADQVKSILPEYRIDFTEVSVFYLKTNPFNIPPFHYRNRDVFDLVKQYNADQIDDFKRFINRKAYPKLVICKKFINEKEYIFGWFHKPISTTRKGFRPGSFTPFSMFSELQANELVDRISTDILTPERLERRTSGLLNQKHYSFSIAGLGSIGSNLLNLLNSFSFPEFHLVDDDFLRIENIGRHFLGFSFVNKVKTLALKNYLQAANPLQKVFTKEKSIIDVIEQNPDFINETDYLFVCIGKVNIDLWLCNALKYKTLQIPVFFIWVEPYLCGGHCLYLHPSNPDFEQYFDEGFFIKNIIPKEIYKEGKIDFSLRETGCQTTYIPYSSNNVISFLSSLFPFICSIIDKGSMKSTSYTWRGNLVELEELSIYNSDLINMTENNRIIETTIQ